jgi:hypothetical protein
MVVVYGKPQNLSHPFFPLWHPTYGAHTALVGE